MMMRSPPFFFAWSMKSNYGVAELLTPGQAGALPFAPASRELRTNRAAARFTSGAPTESDQVSRAWAGPSCGRHDVPLRQHRLVV
jgi:hypothetical protein